MNQTSVDQITLTHIGSPTILIEIGQLRFLTDPTFELAGYHYSFSQEVGSPTGLVERTCEVPGLHPGFAVPQKDASRRHPFLLQLGEKSLFSIRDQLHLLHLADAPRLLWQEEGEELTFCSGRSHS